MTTEERKAYIWGVLNSYGIQSINDFLKAYEEIQPVDLGALCERKPSDESSGKRSRKKKETERSRTQNQSLYGAASAG